MAAPPLFLSSRSVYLGTSRHTLAIRSPTPAAEAALVSLAPLPVLCSSRRSSTDLPLVVTPM